MSIDCDERLVEALREEAKGCSGRYVAREVNVLAGPPADLGAFDLVCVDPPYAREPLVAFSRFSAGFALGLGAIVLVMTNGFGVGEGVLDAIGDALGAEGFGLAETRLAFNVYPLNAFNRFFIAFVGFLLVPFGDFRRIRFAYFFSDCYVFRRRAEPS